MSTPPNAEWYMIRRITAAGFAADPDWLALQPTVFVDGAGAPVSSTSVPSFGGWAPRGFAVNVVGYDADGNAVAPGVGSIDYEFLDVVTFTDTTGTRRVHTSVFNPAVAATAAFNEVLGYLPPGFPVTLGQAALLPRVTALTAPAGATTVEILARGLL